MSAIHLLLRHSIDYAGLFPPAGLDMRAAAGNYAGYLAGDSAWALGRFIVPVSRLPELEAALDQAPPQSAAEPWRLSALVGSDQGDDLERVIAFNERHAAGRASILVDTIELKASSAGGIEDIMERAPDHLQVYLEVPIDRDPGELIAAVAGRGARAKVRTGGITREAFPQATELVRFLQACVQHRVICKATAGLHHPLRSEYRLTYASDSPRGVMFGFLNLFLAAAFLRVGLDRDQVIRVLEESSPHALQVDDQGIVWRDHRLRANELRGARQEVIASFGSCSFTEPITELEALHLLEPRVQQA